NLALMAGGSPKAAGFVEWRSPALAGLIALILQVFCSLLVLSSDSSRELSTEETLWSQQKTQIIQKVSAYQYADAIASLTTFLNSVKDEELKSDLNYYLQDLKDEMTFFNNSVKGLSKRGQRQKIIINNQTFYIDKADENGFTGAIPGVSGSVYKRQWKDIDPKSVYKILPEDLSKTDYFYSALFCYNHNLLKEGEKILVRCLKYYPEQQERISRFIARYRNIPLPPGGFAEYEGQIITAEDKSYLEKGYVKYEGEWMPYDDMMTAKGYVNVNGKWVTLEEQKRLEFYERNLEKLKKLLAPKGIIDKPVADAEKLPWEQARTKETDHYIVKANLTQDALDDICFLMECFYFEACKIFKYYKEPRWKLKVFVFKDSAEYQKNGGPFGSGGVYMGDRIMTYYQPPGTTSVLLHEGTHQFVHLVAGVDVPLWINEGLASYYEASRFEGTSLKTNIINQERLNNIRRRIEKKTISTFEEVINIRLAFTSYEYAHSWSLIYFYINYKNGLYANAFNQYFEAIKKKGFTDPETHKKLFEETFKVSLEVMERQWEDYILNLK
ncbi:MAG: DUF1570 domain-containing protein, partial [Planctomycetota bacterium]|nr:DUF1570 domain-containing protein [Planctomycetota bacterium]